MATRARRVGAWAYYLHTGDRDFLATAYEAVRNSLEHFEREEFDPSFRLFRGPAVYGDGVAAYPDRYSPGGTSSILDWVKAEPEKKARGGFGIPMMTLSTNCVWPTFPRYAERGGFGRHSGTVWPFISGFWGEAALKGVRLDLFERELMTLTAQINRHGQCAEIYHPLTGEIYGGLQEAGRGPDGMHWDSCARQSWTATAYLRMLLTGLFGMRFSAEGISFQPHLPAEVQHVQIRGIHYRSCTLDLTVDGNGRRIVEFHRNGTPFEPFLTPDLRGEHQIRIRMGE